MVGLTPEEGKTRTFRVHTLVLLAFVGPREGSMQAAHFDGDRSNNRLENLRWALPHGNMSDQAHATQESKARAKVASTKDRTSKWYSTPETKRIRKGVEVSLSDEARAKLERLAETQKTSRSAALEKLILEAEE